MLGLLVLMALFGGPMLVFVLVSAFKAQFPSPHTLIKIIITLIAPALHVGLMFVLMVNSPSEGMGLVIPYLLTPIGALISFAVAAMTVSK